MTSELGIVTKARNRPSARPEDVALLQRCIEICRTFHIERVVLVNIRKVLEEVFEPSPDITLFGMALMHHVASPQDRDLLECTDWVYWQLLKRKDQGAGPAK